MSDYGNHGHCSDCGGNSGYHFNDCSYDGINGGHGYPRKDSSDTWKWICIAMMVMFGGLCPPIGAIFFLIFIFGK